MGFRCFLAGIRILRLVGGLWQAFRKLAAHPEVASAEWSGAPAACEIEL